MVSASESYVYISDALGSTRFVLRNGNKNVQDCMSWAVTYKPFGQIYSPAGTDKFSYTGEIVDSPTGLVYLSARYMDPSTGRFMALDPELGHLSMPQTLNRYVYCVNSPLIFTDPTSKSSIYRRCHWCSDRCGHRWWDAALTGGDILAGAAGGAVGGAMAGITCGASILVTAVVVGAGSGASGSFVTTMIETGGDVGKSMETAAIGGVIGGMTGGAGAHLGKIGTRVVVTSKFNSLFTTAKETTQLSGRTLE